MNRASERGTNGNDGDSCWAVSVGRNCYSLWAETVTLDGPIVLFFFWVEATSMAGKERRPTELAVQRPSSKFGASNGHRQETRETRENHIIFFFHRKGILLFQAASCIRKLN